MKPDLSSRLATALLSGCCALAIATPAAAIDLTEVPVTADSTPFIAAVSDLAAAGWVETEYTVSGTANVYEYDADLNVQVQTADVPYTTRILVRRPAAPEDFNGVVVFEMLNPTAGFDLDFLWHYTAPLLLDEGYIWVGLTIKPVAVGTLKFWDPGRYGSLDLPDRGVTWDAYADLAALFRDPTDPENPLAAYPVDQVIGAGYSQSGDWLTTFSNEFHGTALAADGGPAFDGYLGVGGNATARAINDTDPGAFLNEFYDDQRRYNTVDAPYFRVQSETELEVFDFPANNTRQPDSPVFRQWEVAGTSHADGVIRASVDQMLIRDFGGPLPGCEDPISQSPMGPWVRSALHHLTRWIGDGTPPPASLYLELNGPQDVRRDANGNALGGIRIPEVSVPTGTYLPFNSGPLLCIFTGTYLQFSDAKLDLLYPRHGSYVRGVVGTANELRKAGYLLPADAEAYKEAAAESDFGGSNGSP